MKIVGIILIVLLVGCTGTHIEPYQLRISNETSDNFMAVTIFYNNEKPQEGTKLLFGPVAQGKISDYVGSNPILTLCFDVEILTEGRTVRRLKDMDCRASSFRSPEPGRYTLTINNLTNNDFTTATKKD